MNDTHTQISHFILSFVQHIIPYCCTVAQNGFVYFVMLSLLKCKFRSSVFFVIVVVVVIAAKNVLYTSKYLIKNLCVNCYHQKFSLKYSMYMYIAWLSVLDVCTCCCCCQMYILLPSINQFVIQIILCVFFSTLFFMYIGCDTG